MMYVLLIAFFLLMGKMISEQSHSETEQEAENNFIRSEYRIVTCE